MNHFLAALALAGLFATSPTAVDAQATTAHLQQVTGPTMTVGPATLVHGGTANITYSNPGKAGQTIVVTIDNGMRRTPESQTIEIQLDENGQGSATWTVPKWACANFNAPDVTEVSRAVQ